MDEDSNLNRHMISYDHVSRDHVTGCHRRDRGQISLAII